MRRLPIVLLLALLSLVVPAAARADGVIIDPRPPCQVGQPCPPPCVS